MSSRFYEGLSYRRLKNYRDAVVQFETVIDEFRHQEEAPKALVEKSLIALELNELDEMKRELGRITLEYPDHDLSKKAGQSLALAESFYSE